MDSIEQISAEEAAVPQGAQAEDRKKAGQRSFLARASMVVLLGTLTSRFFGFIREMVMAAYFGSGMAVDAFQVAYMIPNLLLQLFGSAAIGSAFIPVITTFLTNKEPENVNTVASSVANFLAVFFFLCMVAGFFIAPQVTRAIAPGYAGDVEKFRLTVLMTRVMFPSILFLGMSGFVMGMLHSYNHFTAPAFAPVCFNILIITSVVVLTRGLGPMSLAIGVTLGGLIQLLFQIPFLKKRNWRYSLTLAWHHPGVKQIITLFIPIVFSLASIEINVFVDTRFASLLAAGSVAALHYALRIWYLPMGLFAVTISTVLFPKFSRHSAMNDLAGLKESYSLGLRSVFLIMVPASMLIIVLARPIVKLLFMRGAFGMESTNAVAYALVFYTLGLTSAGVLHLTNRAFYSLKDTLTPTLVTVAAIAVNYLGDWVLSRPLGHGGIALSTSLVMTFNFACLFIILRRRMGDIDGRRILSSLIKILIASCLLGIVSYAAWRLTHSMAGDALSGQILAVGTGTGAGALMYLAAAKILGIHEMSAITRMVLARFTRRKGDPDDARTTEI
ncbi:MAG: murein biosynthesis integral membrane protein MurJ [bacterium]